MFVAMVIKDNVRKLYIEVINNFERSTRVHVYTRKEEASAALWRLEGGFERPVAAERNLSILSGYVGIGRSETRTVLRIA